MPILPYSDYLKHRVYLLHAEGLSPRAIVDTLAEEGQSATWQGITKLIKKIQETGSLARHPGSGRPSKVTPQVETIVEALMHQDDETAVI